MSSETNQGWINLEKYKTEFERKKMCYGPTKVTVKTLLQNK